MVAKPMTSMPGASTSNGSWLRHESLCLIVLFAAVFACWLPRLKGPIDLRWDGGVYYVLGTSLAEGKGYRLLNEPGEIEANQYPPLLPAVIAAHQRLLGTNDPVVVGQWLRIFYFLIFTIYILTIYLMARSYLPSAHAFLTTLVTLFNLDTYFLSDICFPEIPFALATTLFILCSRKTDQRTYGVLEGLLAVAAYTLRTAGIALLAAWVGESILKRDYKRAALRSAVSAGAVFGWLLYISAVEAGTQYRNPAYEYQRADYLYYNVSYARNVFRLKEPFSPELGSPSLGDISARFLRNLKAIPLSLGESVSSRRKLWELECNTFNLFLPFSLNTSWVLNLALGTLGCLILGGIGLQLARRQWVIPLYVLLSLATICLTPWPEQFTRYLAPLAPFLALSLFTLLLKFQMLSRKVLPVRWKALGTILSGVVVAVILPQQSLTIYLVYSRLHQRVVYSSRNGSEVRYRLFYYPDTHRAFNAGIDWLKSRAKPGDVVASSMPHWVYLRTGLKSVMPPFEQDPVKTQRLLDSVPVSYMIVDEGLALETRKYTFPVTQTFPDRWRRVYSDSVITEAGEEMNGRFEIYQRIQQ